MSGKCPKIKVAVLGGGVGAMTAAFELTSTPELRERYEVTVHQLGWRLGGKGASGRDADRCGSIQEHGLHMWMGFYHNAFRAYRELFLEWKRPPDHPWKTWNDAFTRQDVITFMQKTRDGWSPWTITFPEIGGLPGDPGTTPTIGELLVLMIGWLKEIFHASPPGSASNAHGGLAAAHEYAQTLPSDSAQHTDEHQDTLLGKLGGFVDWVKSEAEKAEEHLADDWRRLRELMELGWAFTKGIYEDELHDYASFDKIDCFELKAWLAKYGAGPVATDGEVLRSFYDLAFCFEGGDTEKPSVAAGCALRTLLRMGLGYKGSVLWKMNAGMGDVVFTPFYEVLRARGVRFEFFHAVRAVELTPSGGMIGRVRVGRQVTLKTGEYEPLVPVKKLDCWPSEPLYDQIVEGEELKSKGVDLESRWADWADREEIELLLGRDFDVVVLGISLGALAEICPQLVAAQPAWRAMVEGIPTVQTQAAQLWLTETKDELGWTGPVTVLTSYAEPLSTWADMSHLLPMEDWPVGDGPKSLAYLCGTMKGPPVPPPPDDRGFPERSLDATRAATMTWLGNDVAPIWPKAVGADGRTIEWRVLFAPPSERGPTRLASQYVRCNIDPSERYVQSPPNSTRLRLEPGDCGFFNLVLAGDWVYTGINGGSVEAAAMGGMKASRALCGVPATIPGDVTKPGI
jgi:uncharacterized protein with NAD-binding domain and iron-sulfur cluster